MNMYGSGILKGLGVTLKEFVSTYVDDIKKIPSRYAGGREEIDQTDAVAQTGLFTVQYPEEHRKLPERFRYIPMLVYEPESGEDRCTACGICAKVCPPQCIWIVRDKDEKGKPITRPAEFYIDASICMNCGLCAEFCPFDAIKMNHDFEIAAQQRMPAMVFDLKQLRVPTTYYARIRPTDWAAEEEARKAKEAEKAAKPERPAKPEAGSKKLEAGAAAPVATPVSPAPVAAVPAAEAVPAPAAPPAPAAKRTPEEVERMKAEAAARRAAKAAESGEAGSSKLEAGPVAPPSAAAAEPVAPAAEAVPAAPVKRTPEEIERLKAEAAVRRAAKVTAGGEAGSSKLEAGPVAPPPAAAPEPVAPVAEATPAAPAKRTPEEIERLKAEAAARRAAKTAQG
jgi:NADH-quinone oxidoreductase subunit I